MFLYQFADRWIAGSCGLFFCVAFRFPHPQPPLVMSKDLSSSTLLYESDINVPRLILQAKKCLIKLFFKGPLMQNFRNDISVFHSCVIQHSTSFPIQWLSILTSKQKQFIKRFFDTDMDLFLTGTMILLMAEILHQLIGSLSHYSQGFVHPRWCRISSINSRMSLMFDRSLVRCLGSKGW